MPDEPRMKERVCPRSRCFRLQETAEAGFPDVRLGASVSIRLARSEGTQEAVAGERAQNAKKLPRDDMPACRPAGRPVSSPMRIAQHRWWFGFCIMINQWKCGSQTPTPRNIGELRATLPCPETACPRLQRCMG